MDAEIIKIEVDIINIGNLLKFIRTRNKFIVPNKTYEKVKEVKIKENLSNLMDVLFGYKKIIDELKINIYESIDKIF